MIIFTRNLSGNGGIRFDSPYAINPDLVISVHPLQGDSENKTEIYFGHTRGSVTVKESFTTVVKAISKYRGAEVSTYYGLHSKAKD